ncbi:putative alpha-L-fucosidase [Culicoides brevitarsis]|uniref:putative alpha-L-fucosidase n=1 Tax=Culicoides brevitarsis TaxID=469753 RepID=UPI00307C7264
MKHFLSTTLFFFIAFALFIEISSFDSSSEDESRNELDWIFPPWKKYTPDWKSLDSRPLPKWYDEAKVGIFIHWGVYSVPSYGSEWFWWYWKGAKKSDYVSFMENNYKPGFTYQEFARDFTAELFNPNEWAKIFNDSGAKYIVLTSKHHEGFTLWPSRYSFSWNAMEVGPHRDLVGELREAITSDTGIHFGLYHSLFEWFNPVHEADKQNNFTTQEFVWNKVWPEMKELVEKYKPEVFWSDGDGGTTPEYWNSTDFLAWLYNESPVRKTVVTNDRWGDGTAGKHGDFFNFADRFNPGHLLTHKWENAFTIDRRSWGHRDEAKYEDFMTPEEIIHEIVSTVSCNGNVLINVGPTRFGTIEPIFVERFTQMGRWLRRNGEAIYKTKPWIHQNDTLSGNVWYTASKKVQKDPESGNKTQFIYATVLKYPYETNFVELGALNEEIFNEKVPVELLGYPEEIKIVQSKKGFFIKFPYKHLIDHYGLEYAWTFKINVFVK